MSFTMSGSEGWSYNRFDDYEAKLKAQKEAEAAAEEQTEEVVEEVLEKTEAEEQLPNNNVEVAEAEPTLREKFQNAFLKENITIKY